MLQKKSYNEIKPYTYLIKFKPTNQVYYGSRCKNVKLGLIPEQDLFVKYFTSCKQIKKLIKEYGISHFEWQIRKDFDTQEQCDYWEKTVLRRMKVLTNDIWLNNNVAGRVADKPEYRQAISDFHKNKPKSDEHRANISKALKGKKKSKEHIENLRKGHIGLNVGAKHVNFGKKRDPEIGKKISAANKGKPKNNSEEVTKKRRERMLGELNPGKNKSIETRIKISTANSGENNPNWNKPRLPETKNKIKNALINKPKSDTHKKNISISHIGKKKDPQFVIKGSKIHTAKLSEFQVLEIRNNYIKGQTTYRYFAQKYNISNICVRDIILRNSWKHI
jgi:hypothetical protein